MLTNNVCHCSLAGSQTCKACRGGGAYTVNPWDWGSVRYWPPPQTNPKSITIKYLTIGEASGASLAFVRRVSLEMNNEAQEAWCKRNNVPHEPL